MTNKAPTRLQRKTEFSIGSLVTPKRIMNREMHIAGVRMKEAEPYIGR